MPDNPLKKNAGNKIRALSFLHYFKSRGFQIHFVSEYFWGNWTEQDIIEFENSGLAFKTSVLKRKASKKNLLFYFIAYKLPEFFRGLLHHSFPDLATYRLKSAFNNILKQDQFDYVFVNYASWAGLIERNPLLKGAKTIIDTHDFLTAQNQHKFNIGKSLNEEIRRLSLFDRVLAISAEEQYIFDQFCKSQVTLAPMMIEKPSNIFIPFQEKKIDLIYVASKNPHNVTSFKWFIEEVYPLLPQSISVCIIGQISAYINGSYPNITTIPFAEDLGDYYQQAKVAVCPMLSGTGVKIKVIEALSYHLPVVCNSRGVDGLLNKSNNGCLVSDTPEGFSSYILALLNDVKTYEEQSLLAKYTFESGYEQETCYKKLDELFKL